MSKATEAVSIPVQDLWRWQAVLDGIVAALGDWGCGETSAVLACLREEFRILACPEADE